MQHDMERRTISSSQTFLMKVIFPILWIAGFGIGTLGLWSNPSARSEMQLQFLAAWVIGSACILWICAPLKRVRIDATTMYVSNYVQECAIPLNAIERVSEVRWVNIHPVTVYFRSKTPFGDHIRFMPKVRMFALWSSHPIVAELKQLASQHAA
jgi:hypothetical protein